MTSALPASRSLLGIHRDAFACPSCHGALDVTDGIHCDRCDASYLTSDGLADFVPAAMPDPGIAAVRFQDPLIASRYETCRRPAFFRIMGGNWRDELGYEDEVAYLQARVMADGPVLDLACGAGTWTRAIADAVGVRNVIGLDLSGPLLEQCRARVAGIVAVRGTALALPFRGGSLATVNCWNSLQQLPDPRRVLTEVSRCLRPGGRFTLLTYRPAHDPLARYFQRRAEAALGVTTFPESELLTWLTDAGLEIVDFRGPGSFLLATAERIAA
jgi:SAM-dependent methyltransferase